jgi:hypothetical protein
MTVQGVPGGIMESISGERADLISPSSIYATYPTPTIATTVTMTGTPATAAAPTAAPPNPNTVADEDSIGAIIIPETTPPTTSFITAFGPFGICITVSTTAPGPNGPTLYLTSPVTANAESMEKVSADLAVSKLPGR